MGFKGKNYICENIFANAPVTATIVMVTINEIRICSAVIIIITVTTATTTILQTLIKPSA